MNPGGTDNVSSISEQCFSLFLNKWKTDKIGPGNDMKYRQANKGDEK